jgi:ABC-2 type transport system ATP-binding protein
VAHALGPRRVRPGYDLGERGDDEEAVSLLLAPPLAAAKAQSRMQGQGKSGGIRGSDCSALLIDARGISHWFQRPVLSEVSLQVAAGEVHALLGPNGAGKTTLLRVLAGLLRPAAGSLRVAGCDGIRDPRGLRRQIGLMPSGDGTLYSRLSGLENLAFFARLQGFGRKDAFARGEDLLELVGLAEHAHKRVNAYSHGMQKRLCFARALLTEPDVLLIDEATHDLDPHAARAVRGLTLRAASRGAAVVWTTQRLDEIRGFTDSVTLLNNGAVCFNGSLHDLLGREVPRRYMLRLQNGGTPPAALKQCVGRLLGSSATIQSAPRATEDDYILDLGDGHVLGDALTALDRAGVRILACREERSGIEEAFVSLTEGSSR